MTLKSTLILTHLMKITIQAYSNKTTPMKNYNSINYSFLGSLHLIFLKSFSKDNSMVMTRIKR